MRPDDAYVSLVKGMSVRIWKDGFRARRTRTEPAEVLFGELCLPPRLIKRILELSERFHSISRALR